MNRVVSPTAIAPPAATYAHAVRVEQPIAVLYTSGAVPVDPSGNVPPTIEEQAAVVWENLLAILAEGGMTTGDVVSMTTYVVAGQPLGPVMAARDSALADHLAASTLVTVPELARPEWLVEISLVAAR